MSGRSKALKASDISLDYFLDRSSPEPNSGCWLWTGYLNPSGYARFAVDGKETSASRAVATLAHGPSHGRLACHKCDNRACVNPDHLYWGTHSDNNADMMRRGRHNPAYGQRSTTATLTDEAARQVILAPLTTSNRELAARFGVDETTIARVRTGKAWRHVLADVPRVPRTHKYRVALTPEQVAEIRATYVPWHPEFGGNAIARRLNISRTTVEDALRGRGTYSDTVLREVLADTSKRLNLAAAFVQATLATLKIETGPKK